MAAQISSIRGLVTQGDDNEILKQRDPITANGGLLKVSDFVEILFDDGRVVSLEGPAEFTLDSSFFESGSFDDSLTQISNIESLNSAIDVIDNQLLEGNAFNETIGGINGLNILDTANDLLIKDDIDKELNDADDLDINTTRTTSTNFETATSEVNIIDQPEAEEEIVTPEDITQTTTRDVNEAITLSVAPVTSITEDSVDLNTIIARSIATDPDGGEIVYSISNGNENGYFTINSTTGTITLTQEGVDYVNLGNNLPSFTVNAKSTSGEVSSDEVAVNLPTTISVNDAMTGFEMNAVTNFTEDATSAGDTVTTVKTAPSDEDGGEITYAMNGNTDGYYAIDSSTGEVTLTQKGADLVNGGDDLPGFTVTATSADVDGAGSSSQTSGTLDPSVTMVADTPIDISLNVSENTGVVIDSDTNILENGVDNISTIDGVSYSLSFDYTGGEAIEVYFGDQLVGSVEANSSNTTHMFDVSGIDSDASFSFKDLDGNNVSVSNPYMAPTETMIEYTIDVTASLTDRDGSESLSIELSNLPQGATLALGEAGENGTWIIESDGYDIDLSNVAMYIPESADTFDLTAVAIATESNGDTARSTIVSDTVVDVSLNNTATSTDDSVDGFEDTTLTLTVNDFGDYSDLDGDAFAAIKITDIPENGTLKLLGQDNPDTPDGSIILSADMVVNVSDINIGNLVFVPDENFSGSVDLGFRVGDGSGFSEDSYTTTMNIAGVADAPLVSIEIGTPTLDTIPGETTPLEPIDNANQLSTKSFDGTGNQSNSASDIDGFSGTSSYYNDDYIQSGNTISQTFDFGSEYANQTVIVSFDVPNLSQFEGNDFLRVFSNGDEVFVGKNDQEIEQSHEIEVTLDSDGKAIIAIEADTYSEFIDIDNFLISYAGVENEITGSDEVTIEEDETVSQTFNFGVENAGKEVTVSFDTQTTGDWENSNEYGTDYFNVSINGVNVENSSDYSGYNIEDTHSFTAIVQSDGTVSVSLNVDSTYGEGIVVSNFSIAGDSTNSGDIEVNVYPLDISAELSDSSEILSDITLSGIPDSAILMAGDIEINVNNGVAILTPTQVEAGNITMSLDTSLDQDFDLSVSVTSTDGSDSVTSTDTDGVHIIDDTPQTSDETMNIAVTNSESESGNIQNTNIVLVLDLSGSMTRDGDLDIDGTQERLDIAKNAIEEMIETYEDLGDVNVQLTTFSSTGTVSSWMSGNDAIDAIENLSASGWTNYEDALYETYTDFEQPDADKSIGFFISDGEPTRENIEGRDVRGNVGQDAENGWIDSSYLEAWQDFANTELDELNVIGIGEGISNTTYLDQLAQEIDESSVDVNVMHIVDTTELAQNIVPSVNVFEGTISDNIDYGEDGKGGIVSINIDGTLYNSESMPDNGVVTQDGGKITFDFETGDYTYTTIQAVSADYSESFEVTVQDADGDQETLNININVDLDETTSGDIQTAVLVDGVCEGITYETSSGITGITDENGNFSFRDGDSITFSIGGVVLGVATAEDVASGHTFLQDIADVDRTDLNDEYLENMATFLQSIDTSDSGDNIVITQAMRDALADANIDLRTASEEEVKDLVESVGGTYISEDEAMEHVQDMLEEYAGMEEDTFDTHINDDLVSASLATQSPIGLRYSTNSGQEGEIGENGEFTYLNGDTISLYDLDGNMIVDFDSNSIGTDGMITMDEIVSTIQSDINEHPFEESNFAEANLDIDFDSVETLSESEDSSDQSNFASQNNDVVVDDMLISEESDELSELLGGDDTQDNPPLDEIKEAESTQESSESTEEKEYCPFEALEESSGALITQQQVDDTVSDDDVN